MNRIRNKYVFPFSISICAVLISLLMFSWSSYAQETKTTLRYVGSSTIANFIKDAEPVYGKAQFNIDTEPESEGGEQAILEGRADIAGVARVPKSETLGKGVFSTLIGWDAIAVVVNNSNNVSNLTQAQLKDIFTGKVRNWKELGGPDLEIHPYIVSFESATRKVFRSTVLGEEDYAGCKVISPDVDILAEVRNDPGGIGQISFSFLNSPEYVHATYVKAIAVDNEEPILSNRDYPITRPLFLLWWGTKRVESFITWINSDEGQTVFQKRFINTKGDGGKSSDLPVINYEGSSTVGIFMQNASATYKKANFNVNTEPESIGGEKAIAEGKTQLAGIAKFPQPKTLQSGVVSTLIAKDALTVIVSKDNKVNDLSLEQLKAIFTGKVKNWKELGGNDQLIKTFIVGEESATRKVFQEIVLQGDDYVGCYEISPVPGIINAVADNPGAIGHISMAFLNGEANVKKLMVNGQMPNTSNLEYPIIRPLYLLWHEGNPDIEAFVEWSHTIEAQRIIMRHFIGTWVVGTTKKLEQTGTLVVYTETSPVEDGGVYYYPHLPYEILSPKGELIKRVRNRLSPNDENPTHVELPPGNYLIRPENSSGKRQEFFVNIEANKITKVNVEEIKQMGIAQPDKDIEETRQKDKQIADVVGRFKELKLYGDFRFRGEQDWKSRKSDGTFRDDRGRLRYRLRFGFTYNWNSNLSFEGRIRSGNTRDQQSPHITLGNELEVPGINIDKAFVKGNYGNFWWWAGKNSFPFWKQNELWWDDDVTPEGVAFGSNVRLNEKIKLKPTAAYFIINSLGEGLDNDPALAGAQLTFDIGLKKAGITIGSGYYRFNTLPNQNDGTGNFNLNYQLVHSGVKIALKTKMPVTIGFDYMTNLEDYSEETLITTTELQDDKTGFVASLSIGKLRKKGDILFGYYYSYIQKYSVVDYLSQDDWVRWNYSNATGARSSNFKGHEVRLAYAFGSGFNVVARMYLVEAISKKSPADLTTETANRARIDFNIKF